MTSIEELNPELKGIGRYQFGWADSDDAGADRDSAASTRTSSATSPRRRTSRSGCSTCA